MEQSTGLARQSAETIKQAFDIYNQNFIEITRRAKTRFEERDWRGTQQDAVQRLGLYREGIGQSVTEVQQILGECSQDRPLWVKVKEHYSGLIAGHDKFDLAETFFNSVSRRIFYRDGVDPKIEFVASDFVTPPLREVKLYKTYHKKSSTRALIKEILLDFEPGPGYLNVDLDAQLVEQDILAHMIDMWGYRASIDVIEVVRPIFYRNKGAYIVGRMRIGSQVMPLALSLLNTEGKVFVDAVLLTDDEMSVVFSFTRSYFLVDVERPHELVKFLKSIIPQKRIAELYISIGHNRHGKTELYRDFLQHLQSSTDKFQIAPGEKGMVMTVFTLPSYDFVFKIIKDKFSYPKKTTRQKVLERYQLVFQHDRAGRLIDAQEFEHLTFDKARFSEELLAELCRVAANSVTVKGNSVDITHLYTERRVTPFDVFIRQADPKIAQEVVLDYGQTIKDLAVTNIFPGDLFLKNFGVTRHHRVVFYDYDELRLLTDCNFRKIPQARGAQEEMEADPWFFVGDNDIFPEEHQTFLGLQGKLREGFTEVHGDLFGLHFWRETKKRLQAGEVMDIFPYPQDKRLRQRYMEKGREHNVTD